MEFESTHSNTTAKLSILKLEQENGTSVIKMSVHVTAEEKTNKKNDVKARSLLLMALPNEHQPTFKSLDSIFNRLQKIVSRLEILGVVITQEYLNSNFLTSLPLEWNTHVVVRMNKAKIETISIDDLYNNFKIVEQSVNKSVGASSGAQNVAFMTAPSTSSTNDVNTAKPSYEVSTVSTNVNIASPQVSTASFRDNAVYAFMIENPNGSNLLQQDLEQIHEDDLEAMDLKSVEHPRNKEGQFRNQDNTRKHGNNEDTSSKVMLVIDGVGFDWSDMAEEQLSKHIKILLDRSWSFKMQMREMTSWSRAARGLSRDAGHASPYTRCLETAMVTTYPKATLKIFYHGLNEITQEVLNAAAGGIFLYKTPNQAYQLLEDKVLLKLDWAKNQKTKPSLKKTVAFAAESNNNSDTSKIMARMDAMTMKMDAQYKDF
ncbi:hypothetical protein Tco_0554285 [Tanacetum coccineum]